MGTYALVESGKVINTIIWDGPEESPMEFDKGVTAIEINEGVFAGTGYSYANGKFTAPPLTDEQKEAIEQAALQANISSKIAMMSEASQRIGVLQDAVDMEMATDEEAASLTVWKKYRVLLSRINANTTKEISWPEKPQ